MSDVLKLGKKVVSIGVAFSTMLWSVGASFLAPGLALAVTGCPSSLTGGDMVKVIGAPAIYALDSGLRYRYFADGDAFKSWNMDGAYAGKYVSITSACLNNLSQPDTTPFHVFYRPGTYLLRYVGDQNQLYVLQPNKVAAKISPEVAKSLYGATLAGMPKTVGLSEWPFYLKSGADVATVKAHSGMWVKVSGKTWYVTADSKVREVSAAGLTANRVNPMFVHELPASAVEGYPTGDPITAYEAALSDRVALTGVTPPPAGGSVSVSLASDTPATQSIPQDATGVTFLKFMVKPTSGSATLNDLVVHRTGLGAANDFANVYIYDGDTRLTSGRTVSSDTNKVTFTNMKLSLSGEKKLMVVADLDTTNAVSGDESGFQVLEANGAAVSGVVGNVMRVGASSVSAVTVDNSGSTGSFRLGQNEAEMAKGTINAGSATYDVKLTRLTLTNAGSLANSYLANLKLVIGGKTIATTAKMTDDKVVFSVTDGSYTITKGETKTFYVYGDVTGGRVDDTVKFYVDQTSDVGLIDTQYNAGVNLTNSFASGNQTYTVTGGEITLAGNGPAAQNIGKNVTNVVIQKFSFSTTNAITVKNTRIFIHLKDASDTAVGNVSHAYDLIKNVKLVDLDKNNQTLVGPQSNYGTGTTYDSSNFYKDFTDTYDLDPGTTRHFAVIADIDTAMTSSWKVYAKVDYSVSNSLKYQDNSQYVAAANIVPSSLTGNNMTISGAQLSVSRTTPPNSTTVVKGSNLDALGVLLTPGTADAVKITSLKLRVYASSTAFASVSSTNQTGEVAANAVVNTVSIREDGATTDLATKNLSDLSGTIGSGGYYYVTFSNLNYVVPAGSPKKLIVKLGLKDSITATRYVVVALDADDDIDVETAADGKSVTENTPGCVNCDGATITEHTVNTGGSVTVEVDGQTPTKDVVLGGSGPVNFVTYRLKASQENFTMTGAEVAIATSTHTVDISKFTLTYKNKAGQTVTKTLPINADASATSTSWSDGDLDVWLPKDQWVNVTVGAYLVSTVNGAVTGDQIKIGFRKMATTFGASAPLTDKFIFLGESSNSKKYGATDSIAVTDTTIAAQTLRRTKVTVKDGETGSTSHGTRAQDPIGVFTFTSEAEPGLTQNSTLGTVTLTLSGSLISITGNNTVNVKVYSGDTFDADHLMGSQDAYGYDNGAGNSVTIALSTQNQFSGDKKVYIVVDTTDSDFVDATNNADKLTVQLNNWSWVDGSFSASSSPAATPEAKYPLYGSTYSY